MTFLNHFGGTAGQVTRNGGPAQFDYIFSEPQVALRNRLGGFLHGGFQQPGAVKAAIATFLLSPPGQFRIVNPESHLPSWLVPSYRALYEQGQSSSVQTAPVGQQPVALFHHHLHQLGPQHSSSNAPIWRVPSHVG